MPMRQFGLVNSCAYVSRYALHWPCTFLIAVCPGASIVCRYVYRVLIIHILLSVHCASVIHLFYLLYIMFYYIYIYFIKDLGNLGIQPFLLLCVHCTCTLIVHYSHSFVSTVCWPSTILITLCPLYVDNPLFLLLCVHCMLTIHYLYCSVSTVCWPFTILIALCALYVDNPLFYYFVSTVCWPFTILIALCPLCWPFTILIALCPLYVDHSLFLLLCVHCMLTIHYSFCCTLIIDLFCYCVSAVHGPWTIILSYCFVPTVNWSSTFLIATFRCLISEHV